MLVPRRESRNGPRTEVKEWAKEEKRVFEKSSCTQDYKEKRMASLQGWERGKREESRLGAGGSSILVWTL